MKRKVTESFIKDYDRVVLTQPLAHNKYLKQVYDQCNKGWLLSYVSDSVHHICPFDGVFRDCKECGALDEDFDTNFCTNKVQLISSRALVKRIKDCMSAGLEVKFLMNGYDI